MKLLHLMMGLLCVHFFGKASAIPSGAAVNTCLSKRQLYEKVEWKRLSSNEMVSRENFKQGYDAIYFRVNGKMVGIARKDYGRAIIYDEILYSVKRARKIPNFDTSNADIDPFFADWGTVKEKSGIYICINFPSGELGQSGSFQKVRNVYMLQIFPRKKTGMLYSAIGRVADADR